MICHDCGGSVRSHLAPADFQYVAGGLNSIWLLKVRRHRCKTCPRAFASIPNIENLHETIAGIVAYQKMPLISLEIRFLRQFLGLSGVEFAKLLGKTPETVSRWEHGTLRIDSAAERLIRLIALTRLPGTKFPLDLKFLGQIDPSAEPPARINLKNSRGLWKVVR